MTTGLASILPASSFLKGVGFVPERDHIPIEEIFAFVNPYIDRFRSKQDLVIKVSRFSEGADAVCDIQLDSPELFGSIKIWSSMTFHFEALGADTGVHHLNLSAPYAVLDELVPFLEVMERIYLG